MPACNGQFGAFLQALRIRKGFKSASSLSRRAGIALSHVSLFERGEFVPRWSTAEKIASALGLTDAERAEFYQAIKDAKTPERIREVIEQCVRKAG